LEDSYIGAPAEFRNQFYHSLSPLSANIPVLPRLRIYKKLWPTEKIQEDRGGVFENQSRNPVWRRYARMELFSKQ
jgi:hypothetical protein